jgi:hypothetical protein
VLDILFHRLTTWLAPILVFTMEEVWLERFPGDDSSVHLQDIPETPAAWRDAALAAKWERIRAARRVVTGALEVQRRDKVIGASLEAAPVVHVEDPTHGGARRRRHGRYLHHLGLTVMEADPAPDAFRLPDDPGIGVVFEKADGEKCQRCWKMLPDVGRHASAGAATVLRLFADRMAGGGLFVIDEPESALSPRHQAMLLRFLAEIQAEADAQVILATHSPILMAVPGARLWRITHRGMSPTDLRATDHFRLLSAFTADPDGFVAAVCAGDIDTLL